MNNKTQTSNLKHVDNNGCIIMVVIIGAGIVGAATAYYLSNNACGAGTSITIIDAVGPAAGSSGRAGAFIRGRNNMLE